MDEGQQKGMEGLSVREKGTKKKKKSEVGKKLRYMEMEKRERRGSEKRERKEGGCVVCVVWCKPWVLVDGWI